MQKKWLTQNYEGDHLNERLNGKDNQINISDGVVAHLDGTTMGIVWHIPKKKTRHRLMLRSQKQANREKPGLKPIVPDIADGYHLGISMVVCKPN